VLLRCLHHAVLSSKLRGRGSYEDTFETDTLSVSLSLTTDGKGEIGTFETDRLSVSLSTTNDGKEESDVACEILRFN